MPPKSKYALGHYRASAKKVFTNRENPIRWFNEARQNLEQGKHRLLSFHGVGGQGKSALCRKFIDILKNENPQSTTWGHVDFYVQTHRRADRALLELRKNLVASSKGKIKFPAFEIAITHYWEKEYPEANVKDSLKDIFDRGEGIISALADSGRDWLSLAEELPAGLGLGVKLTNILRNKATENYLKRAKQALNGLEMLQNHELLHKLPYIFASDILTYLEQENSFSPIILIDTYEALWEHFPIKTGLGASEADAWVRDLVTELPGALFVFFGRDKLGWDEDFPNEWQGYLDDHHLLGGLSDEDADNFLKNIPIPDSAIRAAMIHGAQGKSLRDQVLAHKAGAHPYYLDLAVDLYLDMLDDGKQPTIEDIGKTPKEVVERFIRYRSTEEIETLKVLCMANGFDQPLFEAIVSHFKTGYPLTAFVEFTSYSFIEQGLDGLYYMHALMRESLSAALNNTLREQIRAFLFDYFSKPLETLSKDNPKQILSQHEYAFAQAAQYLNWQQPEQACTWFFSRSDIFFVGAKYGLLFNVLNDFHAKCELVFGSEHPNVATSLNNLASLYHDQGIYKNAEPLYKRSLAIREKTLISEHPEVAESYNNLATLYQDQGLYNKAELLLEHSLAIRERSLGVEHPEVAESLNNLASNYHLQGLYVKAEPLYLRSLKIWENVLGLEHLNLATNLNNLAALYSKQGLDSKAEPLYQRSLAIREEILGSEHPAVAESLNNLATTYSSQGLYEKAELLYLRSLAIREEALGTEHPEVAQSLSNLALLYCHQGLYEKAELLYLRSLAIREETLGFGHPYTEKCFNILYSLYQAQGREDEAEKLLNRYINKISKR